ncbi:MAG: hypothetical protein NT031_14370, partial [Planctomycetota bacterium]|nr:hypothetical protein [Planctomycetota bacterium]
PAEEGPPVVWRNPAPWVGKTVRLVGWPTELWLTREPQPAVQLHDGPVGLLNAGMWSHDYPQRDVRIQVTGELVQVEDIPVFRYEKGKPFGHGLPVPEPYSLKDMSRRLVLQNAKWEFLKP